MDTERRLVISASSTIRERLTLQLGITHHDSSAPVRWNGLLPRVSASTISRWLRIDANPSISVPDRRENVQALPWATQHSFKATPSSA